MVLAALPFGAGASVVGELRDALEGKALIDCSNPVGPGFRLLDFDCNHMVPYAKPDEVAALTRELLEAR